MFIKLGLNIAIMKPAFIELLDTRGSSMKINVSYIVHYQQQENEVTKLILSNSEIFYTKTSPVEIDEKIAKVL